MEVKIKGNIPIYGKPGDAGADLVSERDVVLGAGQTILVPTGTHIEIPEGYVGLVHPRSGLAANHGITVLNAPGTIDSGFRGEIQVILHNTSGRSVQIMRGMRIAQLGLGTGALTKFAHRYCPAVKTTVVELNPAVIVSARSMFFTPDDDRRLETLQTDAKAFVQSGKYQNHFDAVQVDLYDAICDGPAVSSLDFYKGCYDILKSPGVLTVNLFSRHKSFDVNLNNICEAFDNRVLLFPASHDC